MDGVWGVQLWGVRLWCLSTVQNCCQHLQRSSHPCLEFMGPKGTGYLSVSRSRKQIFPVAPEFIYFLSFLFRPYDGKWSKTMVGFGPEDDHFVAELTYNYGIGDYKLGNDFMVNITVSQCISR